MNALDVVLLLAAVASALTGFRHGFLTAISSLVGFLLGAWAGLRLAPLLLDDAPRVFSTAVVAVLVVLLVAGVGQFLGALAGRYLRQMITWQPGRLIDASAGAVTAATYLLVFAWAAGVAVASSGLPVLGSLVRGSSVLTSVDRVLPDTGTALFGRFTQLLDRGGFPVVFAPFNRESIVPVEPPAPDQSITPAVLAVQASVVRVQGLASSCARNVTGSGFVYAPGVVITNAHVVAGVEAPRVLAQDGTDLSAEVVWFDPEADIAVLRVPGLAAPPVPYGGDVDAGDPVATIGYPGGGSLLVGPSRVRTEQVIIGPDIYGTSNVAREVFALRAQVQPGDSGGPLVAPDGTVVGIVFAASLDDPDTAYAFTAREALPVITLGAASTTAVSTGKCA